jgi:hypothetical protein
VAFLFDSVTRALSATLVNQTPGAYDGYGSSLAIRGDWFVVGTPHDDTQARNSGSVQVRSIATGSILHELLPPEGNRSNAFGTSLAVSGNLLAVGTPGYVHAGVAVGAVLLYDLSTGLLLQTLKNPVLDEGDQFGFSVALEGTTLIVGTPGDDAHGLDAGAVYVFEVGNQMPLRTLDQASPQVGDRFGSALALSGGTAVVGAPLSDVGGIDAGLVCVFNVATGALTRTTGAPTPAAGDQFGFAVDIDGNNVIIGAPYVDSFYSNSGRAYAWDLSGGVTQPNFLGQTGTANEHFGYAVAISGNKAVVGIPGDDIGGTARLFDWATRGTIELRNNPTPVADELFGTAVAMEGNVFGISAPGDSTINYRQGAAYAYRQVSHAALLLSNGSLQIIDVSAQATSNSLSVVRDGNDLLISDPYEQFGTNIPAGMSLENGNRTLRAPLQLFSSLNIELHGGADTLTLDLSSGDVIPPLDVTYDGGDGNDSLILAGGDQGTVLYDYTGWKTGSVQVQNFGTVTYVDLDALQNTGTSTTSTFKMPAVANTLKLTDDGNSGNNLLFLDSVSKTFVPTTFRGPSQLIAIDPNANTDAVTVNALPQFGGSLTIGASNDRALSLAITGMLQMAANQNVTAFAKSTIQLTNSSLLSTSGSGSIALTSNEQIQLWSSGITTTDGNIQLSANEGAGPISLGNAGVLVNVGAKVEATGSGNVTIYGKGGATGFVHRNYGVAVVGPDAKIAAATGLVTITGVGGGTTNSDLDNHGVFLDNGGFISGGTGAVTVTGTGGSSNSPSGANNYGVNIEDLNSKIVTTGGAIQVTGNGGGQVGVSLTFGGQIVAGGSGGVTVIGTAGNARTHGKVGVTVSGINSLIASAGGNVRVEGYGGGGNDFAGNNGVSVLANGQITAGGMGTVTVIGVGDYQNGNNNAGNIGVSMNIGAKITSAGGAVSVTGTGGGAAASSGSHGVQMAGGEISAGGMGSVTVEGTGATLGGGPYGVWMRSTSSTATITSAGGPVVVRGNGGGSVFSSSPSPGVLVQTNSTISSGGTGAVTVEGRGGFFGAMTGGNVGLSVSGGTVTSSGNILLRGWGGGNGIQSGSNHGVSIASSESRIRALGAGQLTIEGFGGNTTAPNSSSSNRNTGVAFEGGETSSVSGTITVAGTGGGAGSSPFVANSGIWVKATVTSQLSTIQLNGIGGAGTSGSSGVDIGGGSVNAQNSSVQVTGSASVKTADNFGIAIGAGSVRGNAAGVSVDLIADSMNLTATNGVVLNSNRTAKLRTLTPDCRISLGAADSSTNLGLTSAELASINTGTTQIGDGSSGEIIVAGNVTKSFYNGHVSLTAGANRNIALNNYSITLPVNNNLTLNVTGTGAITATGSGAGLLASTVSVFAESGNIGSLASPISAGLAASGTPLLNAQTLGSFYLAPFASSGPARNGSVGLSAGGTGYLTSGALLLTGPNAVGDTTSLHLGNNMTLYLDDNYQDTFAGISGDNFSKLVSAFNEVGGIAPRITLTAASGLNDFKGSIGDVNGSGVLNYIDITKRGGSTQQFSGISYNVMPLRIEGGVVVAQLSTSLGSAIGYTRVVNGGSLRLNNTAVAIAAEPLRLSGSGYLTDAALSVNLPMPPNSVTFNGPITLEGDATVGGPQGIMTIGGVIDDGVGTFGLEKTGNSFVYLNSAHLYSGPTTISGGSLIVNGSLISPAIVNGGWISGSGTIHHQATVNSGGVLEGGLTLNRPGQLALQANGGGRLSLNTGGKLTVNGSVVLGAAGNYPRLDVSGSSITPGKYIIVQNDGTDSIEGYLTAGSGSSLPVGTPLLEGAAISGNFAGSGFSATISYVGGTGNDIEITINADPTIVAIPAQIIDEDASPVTINLSGITAGGTESQTLQVTAVSSNPTLIPTPSIDYTSPATTGTLTFQPAANLNGSATITITVRDAGLDGMLNTLDDGVFASPFTVTVNAINDAPSFVSGGDVVATNFFPQTRAAWVTSYSAGPNEAAQAVTFNVTGYTNATLFATPPAVAANGTLTFTPAFGQFGSSTVTLFVRDNGGTASGGVDASPPQTFTITVTQPVPLQVMWFAPTTTGGVFHFSHDIDPSLLNLYDVQGNLLGPADIEFRAAAGGVVTGSAVVDLGLRQLTFVSTTGKLQADTYTVTLRSAANGVRDSLAGLLDGDANGTAGGDFVYNFSVTPPAANAVTVSIPNFARGPEQSVNLPALTSGIPLSFSNSAGITAATLEIRYNPALLNITSATVAAGLPVGTTVNLSTSTPGVAVITFNSPTALAAGTTRFVDLQAVVPSTAHYRNKHALDIANIVLNGGALPSLDDDGVHVVAYFADVTGNGTYSAQDASLLARLAVGIDTGLEEFALLDPTIIGDITGNGAFSATDTSLMLQAAVGIEVPELPTPLPTVSLTQGGPDPKLSIPQNLVASAGGSLLIPVDIDSIVNLTGNGLASADLVIYYDPTVLEISSAALGRLVAQRGGWLISSHIDPLAGRIDVSLAGLTPLEGEFSGELVQLQATVKADAPAGASAINLAATSRSRSTQLNEGFLTLIPAPTDAANDAIDGRVMITAANDSPSNQPAVRRTGEQLHITGTTGNDRILVSQVDAEHVRVRIGNRVLGTFAAPQGLAINALTGNDFIYVAPNSPAAVIAASINHDDLIFAGDNTLLVEAAAQTELAAAPANQLSPHDLALLQLLAGWHDSQPDNGPPSPRTGVRRR